MQGAGWDLLKIAGNAFSWLLVRCQYCHPPGTHTKWLTCIAPLLSIPVSTDSTLSRRRRGTPTRKNFIVSSLYSDFIAGSPWCKSSFSTRKLMTHIYKQTKKKEKLYAPGSCVVGRRVYCITIFIFYFWVCGLIIYYFPSSYSWWCFSLVVFGFESRACERGCMVSPSQIAILQQPPSDLRGCMPCMSRFAQGD